MDLSYRGEIGRAGNDDRFEKLRRATQMLRVEFIQTYMDAAATWVRLADTQTRIGKHDAADRLVKQARLAYETAAMLLLSVNDEHHRQALCAKHAALGQAVRRLAARLRARSADLWRTKGEQW